MNPRLKETLRKLIERRDSPALGDDDYAAIEQALGIHHKTDDNAPLPLWYWIRANALRWKQTLDLPLDWLTQDLDPILLDAGAPKGRLDTPAARRNADVTREGLVRSVRKHLQNDDTMTRSYAALLVGLANLNELLPSVTESLTSGREERAGWGQPVIGALIESLVMSGHPESHTIVGRYVTHEDDRIRRAAQVCMLLRAESLSDAELAKALEHAVANSVVLGFPNEMIRAAKAGFDLESKLRAVLNSTWRSADFLTIVKMALGAHLDTLFTELLEHDNYEVRMHAALEAGFAGHSWTQDILTERLENESESYLLACVVAAIAALDREKKSWIKSQLEADSDGRRIGAAWACTFISGNDDVINEMSAEGDQSHAVIAAKLVRSPDASSELIELRWREAQRHWSTQLQELANRCGLMLNPVPPCVTDAKLLIDEQAQWQEKWFETAREFYTKYPERLCVRLSSEGTPNETVRIRAHNMAALIGGPIFEAALERRLADCSAFNEALELFLECRCAGGPHSELGRVVGKLVLGEADHPVDLEPEDFVPAVVWAFGGDYQIAARAMANLGKFGEQAEHYLYALLSSNDETVGKAVASAISQLSSPTNPFLADAAALLSGTAKRVSELDHLPLLASSGCAMLRAKVAEVAGFEQNKLEDVLPMLVALAGDQHGDVALAAMGSLAAHAGGKTWVQRLLIEATRSENWQTRRQSIDIMTRNPSPAYLTRLLEVLERAGADTDYDLQSRTVRAAESVAEKFPECGLVVLDIREPRRVTERYGVDEQIDWSADQRSEALRLLMVALDRRKDAAVVEKNKGRKVLLGKPGDQSGGNRSLSGSEFEAIAMYLQVTFTDDETGAIVAEVGEEPSGEVLNALLQQQSIVITSAAWS